MNNVTVTQAIATNNLQRPASIATSGASPNWTTGAYSFDGSNNIVKMGSDWFIYDPVSRIKTGKVFGGTLQQDYTYDAFGFITSITTTPGGTQSFASVSGTNHISGTNNYDAAGNMLFWGTYTYSWDRLNKVQKLTTPTEHWYFYSADGERIVEREGSVTSPTTTTLTIRGLDGKVLRIYTKPSGGSFSWSKDYVYRDGQLLATVDSGGTKHFHLDHLGTPRWITNASAAKVAEHTYYPFGVEASGTTDWERMKLTGHERDLQGTTAQTDDLDYMHARHYNLNIGRFLTLDPVRGDPAAPQSFNLFAYVRNNPVNAVDPFGLDWVPCPGHPEDQCWAEQQDVDLSGGKEGWGWPWPDNYEDWCSRDLWCSATRGTIGLPGTSMRPARIASGPKAQTEEPIQPPLCVSVFGYAVRDALFPFTPSLASAGEPIANFYSLHRFNSALAYAASRPNALGGQGLLYPFRSSVFRAGLATARMSAAIAPLLTLDLAIAQALFVEFDAAARGDCRPTF